MKTLLVIATALLLCACMDNMEHQLRLNDRVTTTAAAPFETQYKRLPQAKRLQQLEDLGTTVIQRKSQIHLIFPLSANFKPGFAVINADLREKLDLIVELLDDYPYAIAQIHGYTDAQGPTQDNVELGTKRAKIIIAYLESQGIPSNRLIAFSHGDEDPRGDNASEIGRFANRRIEIVIVRVRS